jgi:hypothetical protein
MIYIYGDSHARYSFAKLKLTYKDFHFPSITMFRIGRDNSIINFDTNYKFVIHDVIVLSYGEVDCRCHIQQQINKGREEDAVINELVEKYFQTIVNSIGNKKLRVIIVGVIPPTRQTDYESLHGPITHEFPFVGTDEDRVRFTQKVNVQLEKMANNNTSNRYKYFNPYSYYTREDGTLKHELSDTTVHLGDTSHFLEEFYKIL